MTDLSQATMDAVFAALDVPAVTIFGPVFSNVPANTSPPFIEIGAIDSEEIGAKGDSLEQIAFEIEFQHRGNSRKPLLAAMHAVRQRLAEADLVAPGAILEDARWLASATDREEDGVTYHGIHRFELLAQAEESPLC